MSPEDIEKLKQRIDEEEKRSKEIEEEQEREEERRKEKEKEERKGGLMKKSIPDPGGIANIILYAGGLYLIYKFTSSWGIINSSSYRLRDSVSEWTPLSEQEIRKLMAN